jgi:glycine cleavage system H protein
VVESVKAASDVYAPVSGEVVEANAEPSDTPETVNRARGGWFARLVRHPAELDLKPPTIPARFEVEALIPTA